MIRPMFELRVDSGDPYEPKPRRFGSLGAAWAAFDSLEEVWQPFAEVRERRLRPGSGERYYPRVDRDGKVQP